MGTLTNNWRAIKNAMLTGGLYRDTGSKVLNTGGTVITSSANYTEHSLLADLMSGSNLSTSYYQRNAVRFGSGNTAEDAQQYNLASVINSGISYTSVSNGAQAYDTDTDTWTRTYVVTISNTLQTTLTIREWGIFTLIISGNETMLFREVLATPLELDSGETADLTFTVSMTLGDPVS